MRRASALASTKLPGRSVGVLTSEVPVTGTDGLGADCGWVDAFIRDELSKGRYDPGVSKVCFEMLLELFGRTLKVDLGEREREGGETGGEDVC